MMLLQLTGETVNQMTNVLEKQQEQHPKATQESQAALDEKMKRVVQIHIIDDLQRATQLCTELEDRHLKLQGLPATNTLKKMKLVINKKAMKQAYLNLYQISIRGDEEEDDEQVGKEEEEGDSEEEGNIEGS